MVPRAIKGLQDPGDRKVIQDRTDRTDRKDQKDRKVNLGSLAIPANRATATAPSCATEGVR